jgi:hypothetical protein
MNDATFHGRLAHVRGKGAASIKVFSNQLVLLPRENAKVIGTPCPFLVPDRGGPDNFVTDSGGPKVTEVYTRDKNERLEIFG